MERFLEELEEPEEEEMESLPIIDSQTLPKTQEWVPNPSKYYYHVRVTDSTTTKDIIAQGLKAMTDTYVVSEELSSANVKHFHALVESNIPYQLKEQKKFKLELKRHLKLPKSGFSTSAMKGPELLSYIMKDGDYISEGFPHVVIKTAQIKSYIKFDKKAFAKKQHELEDQFILGKLDVQKFYKEFGRLKSDYKQGINQSWLDGYVLSLAFRKNKNYLESWSHERAAALQQKIFGISEFDQKQMEKY